MAKPSSEDALKKIREEEIERLARRQALTLGLPFSDLLSHPVREGALRMASEEACRNASAVVFEKTKTGLKVALLDSDLPAAKAFVSALEAKNSVEVFVASPRGIERFLKAYKELLPPREEITGTAHISKTVNAEYERSTDASQLLQSRLGTESQKVGELAAYLFAGAVALDASDIHLESEKESAALRLRLDGVLAPFFSFAPEQYRKIRDRIKLLAGMKLNIQTKPQDGRFTIALPGQESIEVRASTIPGAHGENVVLRILNPKTIHLSLEALGLRKDDLSIIEEELKKPNGAIIVTGPTGSGKTTTLYAFLRKVNTPAIKIVTIEDPIEYRIQGVEQTQVDESKGYTFAQGLIASLRQDPDVILVGEIRDLETAQTAIHSALTGHLVFTTLHTNDAAGTIPRLVDLGVKPGIIAPAINIAIAQRLVRRLCPHCSQMFHVDADLLAKLNRHFSDLPSRAARTYPIKTDTKLKKASAEGCSHCSARGYKGRVGVFELFRIGPDMEELIKRSPTEEDVRQLAKKLGMVTMIQDALLKVLEGVTDIDEVERVVGAL